MDEETAEAAALLTELEAVDLVMRAQPDDALTRAARVQARAQALGRADVAQRAELVRAEVDCRQGRLAEGGRLAQSVLARAQAGGDRFVQARAHWVLELFFASLGELARSLEHALLSVELLDDDAPVRVRLDHRLRLAGAVGSSGDFDGARVRFAEVAELARSVGSRDLLWRTLSNMAWNEYEAGEPERALEIVEQVRTVVDGPLHPLTLDTRARALLVLGRYDEAEAALAPLETLEPGEVPDRAGRAECLLALAEARRRGGRLEAAQRALDACRALCETSDLRAVRTLVHGEQTELLAAAGRFEEALAEHRLFCAQTVAALKEVRDARVRTMQAVFETAEARRETRRYRELSLRDALTGLYNRRHLEEVLPRLLRTCEEQGDVLTVALVDLDHFKRVNDECSHEVGDRVLRTLAELLTEGVRGQGRSDPAFAARLGGEEFVLVLPGLGAAEAGAVLERLRRSIAEHPWHPLTGGVPVRASIGATVVSGARVLTMHQALSRADDQLYGAKVAGRDRVRVDALAPATP